MIKELNSTVLHFTRMSEVVHRIYLQIGVLSIITMAYTVLQNSILHICFSSRMLLQFFHSKIVASESLVHCFHSALFNAALQMLCSMYPKSRKQHSK